MFKTLLVGLCLLSSSAAWSQACRPQGVFQGQAWLSNNLKASCENLRSQYRCAALEEENMEELKSQLSADLASGDKDKIASAQAKLSEEKARYLTCDRTSATRDSFSDANWLGREGCLVNGLLLTVDSIKNLGVAVVDFFKDAENCYQDIEKKREMVVLFNMGVSEKYTMDPKIIDSWTCGEIQKQLFARHQAYQDNLVRESMRQQLVGRPRTGAAIAGGRTPALPDGVSKIKDILAQASESLQSAYMCYTPKAKTEMICAGLVNVVGEIAAGGGAGLLVKAAVVGMRSMVHSTQAANRIRLAIARGQKVDLADASLLSDADRLRLSEDLLKLRKPLTAEQKKAIIEAHEIGLAEGRGFGSYTTADLAAKARILRKAGLDQEQVRLLMETGITGAFGHSQRVLAERMLGQAMIKGRDKIPAAQAEGRKFYLQHIKGKNSVFTPNERGFDELMNANNLGLSSREAVDAFKSNMLRDPKKVSDELRAGYSSVNRYIDEQLKIRPSADAATQQMIDYRIYRAKELRMRFYSEYIDTKYANKYGEVDLNRLDVREARLRDEVHADLVATRKKMDRLGIPVESDVSLEPVRR